MRCVSGDEENFFKKLYVTPKNARAGWINWLSYLIAAAGVTAQKALANGNAFCYYRDKKASGQFD